MGFFDDKPPKFADLGINPSVEENAKKAWLDVLHHKVKAGTLSPADATKAFESLNVSHSTTGLPSFQDLIRDNHTRIHPDDLPKLISTSLSMFLGRHQYIKERLPDFFIDAVVPLFEEAGVDIAVTTDLDWRFDSDLLSGLPRVSVRITNRCKEYKGGIIYLPENLMSQLQTLAKAGEYK